MARIPHQGRAAHEDPRHPEQGQKKTPEGLGEKGEETMKTALEVKFKSSPNLASYLHAEIKKLVESKGATDVTVRRTGEMGLEFRKEKKKNG